MATKIMPGRRGSKYNEQHRRYRYFYGKLRVNKE
jgi:hypothetical protein